MRHRRPNPAIKTLQLATLMIASSFLLAPHLLRAEDQAAQQADDLASRYKVAVSRNEVELAVGFLCDAARLDPKKYDKKCVTAQHHENEQLQSFDGFFTAGQKAMQQKDYAGAIKQLSKISFGLRHEDAQRLIQDARTAESHPQLLAANRLDLGTAQSAYDHGDLGAAEASAKRVQVAELQPVAQQILTNIRIYQDAMQAGDAARQSGSYAAAEQKYKFALAIRPNGPGNPSGKLQEIDSLIAESAITKPSPTTNKPILPIDIAKKQPDPLSTDAAKIKTALAEGRAAESPKDVDAALQAYERVLAINPRQTDALTGKQRVMDSIPKTPQAIEATLATGLHSYYRSQLAEAGDALSLYLTAGGNQNRGVAYFYLGATFASQALLSDPRARGDYKKLEQHALLEFKQARCEHYNPVERYISPRVLSMWNKTSC